MVGNRPGERDGIDAEIRRQPAELEHLARSAARSHEPAGSVLTVGH
jgi:hypothetical protein